ncbi:MAG: VWA domain-containing protein [Anaerolineae bacterium]|nr:VWA domain-containing protein [Anaerolineae bacterium]
MLHFANPWVFLALLALPVLIAWLWRREQPVTMQYSDLRLVHDLPRSPKVWLRWLPTVLRLFTLTLLIVAAARPQASREREVIRGQGVDIVLAVDISGSMAALDFEPQNRLEAAKQVIDEFIHEREYDRIGIVVFAGEAFSQCPPTFDYDVLRRLLNDVDLAQNMGLDKNAADGTAIGMGLAQAAAMLQESDAKSRVIILLTDGVNNKGQIDPLTAAQAANALDIKVYTIGMGRPGQVPFPVDTIFGRRTQMVESELDEETLQAIANATDALYFRATNMEGLRDIYEQINQLEKSEVEVQKFTRYKELAAWVLFPALGLLWIEMILRHTLLRTLP